jgi:hypothetical protein
MRAYSRVFPHLDAAAFAEIARAFQVGSFLAPSPAVDAELEAGAETASGFAAAVSPPFPSRALPPREEPCSEAEDDFLLSFL